MSFDFFLNDKFSNNSNIVSWLIFYINLDTEVFQLNSELVYITSFWVISNNSGINRLVTNIISFLLLIVWFDIKLVFSSQIFYLLSNFYWITFKCLSISPLYEYKFYGIEYKIEQICLCYIFGYSSWIMINFYIALVSAT